MIKLHRLPGRFLLRVGALLALTAAIGVAYQQVEDFIPYWDFARIEMLFRHLERAFNAGVVYGLEWLFSQINHAEYNSVFALPLMVAPSFVGSSRDTIVLTVLLLYSALYLVAFGFLLRKVLGYRSLDDLSLAQLGSALFVPSILTATLAGFETIAVLPVLTVAVVVFLAASWPERETGPGARIALFVLAGVLLAATFLVRRAYAYTVISFYTTASLVLLGEMLLGHVALRSRDARVRIAGMAAAGMGSALVLLVVARDRVLAVLATPYDELYAPWKEGPANVGHQLLISVGGLVLIFSAAGYVLRNKVLPPARRVMAALLGGTAVLGFLHWILLIRLRMRLDKPMLYAPMIAVGLALLFTGRDKCRWSNLARGLCFALLIANLAISLGAVPEIKAVRATMFAQPKPPQTRDDMESLLEMVTWLRSETMNDLGQGEPILVLASTGDFNDSLVQEAETHFFGWDDRKLYLPHFNPVDRTSNYPVWLHNAQWVLVARPFLSHSSDEERRLLRFGWDEFAKGRGISRNFEKLEQSWVVGRSSDNTAKVEVWRRTSPDTAEELFDLLERAKEFVVHHPIFPDLWVRENAPLGFQSSRVRRSGEHYSLLFTLGRSRWSATSAVLMKPLAPGVEIRVESTVARGSSADITLVAELLDTADYRSGEVTPISRETVRLEDDGPSKLVIRTPGDGLSLLRIEVVRRSELRIDGPPPRVQARVEIGDHSR